MIDCKKCGMKNIPDDNKYCPNCGSFLEGPCPENSRPYSSNSKDQSSLGWGVLGFFFPLIGLILFLVWRTELPLRAKSVGKGALISAIISIVVMVIYFVMIGSLIGGLIGSEYVRIALL